MYSLGIIGTGAGRAENNQPPVPNRVAQEDAPKFLSYTAICVPKRIGKNTKVY